MLLSGDVEFYLQNLEYLGSASVRHARQLIATIGDRIALEHCMATAEPGRTIGVVEVESLMLTEIDASARLVASITFDPDDRRAAFVDARARFAAGEAAAVGGQAPIVAFDRAFTAHDWEALRTCVALDAGIRDNRSLGVFSVDRDQWVDSVDHWVDTLRMWGDLVPDVRAEPFHILAWNGHGQVVVTRLVGTMRDGGPVEYLFVTVFVTEGDRIRHLDVRHRRRRARARALRGASTARDGRARARHRNGAPMMLIGRDYQMVSTRPVSSRLASRVTRVARRNELRSSRICRTDPESRWSAANSTSDRGRETSGWKRLQLTAKLVSPMSIRPCSRA
jgi:hypothetical protein